MIDDIMTLSNELIYKNQLRSGSDEVSKRVLKLPNPSCFAQSHEDHGVTCSDSCWIETLLAERYFIRRFFALLICLSDIRRCKAVFVDTDNLPALESRAGDLVQNTTEAILVQQLTEALLQSGVSTHQIGIISLYRQQIKVLNRLLENRPGIEILTADRSQGRDKDCIIISMVRSNEDGIVSSHAADSSYTNFKCHVRWAS
jgi:DNA replication ATP-dependent helicase Dna2